MRTDLKAIGDAVILAVRGYVGQAVASLAERLDDIDTRLKALPPAEKGEPGKDADAAAIAEEVAGSVLAQVMSALEAIPAPKDGKDVPIEQVQRMVDDAVTRAVAAVRMPQDGVPGRDALDLEILPAIDESKAYPRSTYAKHAGGLWRSFETTQGMRGWECIVEGVAELNVSQDDTDPRVLHASWALSSGKAKQAEFHVPMVVDQGVYRDGTAYKQGDGCTWARNYWIAKKDTLSKPEAGSDWRLAVKSGRDGRDGRDATPKRGNGSIPVG